MPSLEIKAISAQLSVPFGGNPGEEPRLKRQIITIVDDRLTNLKILERLARSLDQDVEVRTFDRAQLALDDALLAPHLDRLPDLVITDLKMPEIDGSQFIRRFRSLPGCAEVPVIAITAYGDRELRMQALEAGATDFLLSPVDHQEFVVRSRNLLTLRRQQLLLIERASSLEEKIIVEERRHQQALRESHELLMRVINAIPVLVSATDFEGRYVFVNDCFAGRVNLPAARVIGCTPADIFDEVAAHAEMDRDRKIIAATMAPGAFEQSYADATGRRRVLFTTKALLRDVAGPGPLVVTASLDITPRKEVEQALRTAKEEAELASRSKSEFLANMSHELRTPLNAIIGFSQVMADEIMGPMGTPKYRGYARDICASAQHLLAIITDILDVSKLEAGAVELDEQEIDVGGIFAEVLHLVRDRARSLDVAFDIEVPADLPRLRSDPLKLKQILLNLVTNAVKFSHEGGRVALRAALVADGMELAVADHGIGMDEAGIATAITRFGQVASAWNRRHAGTGLGLPLAISLVEYHGGELAIESRKGEGTTVTIRMPASRIVLRDEP